MSRSAGTTATAGAGLDGSGEGNRLVLEAARRGSLGVAERLQLLLHGRIGLGRARRRRWRCGTGGAVLPEQLSHLERPILLRRRALARVDDGDEDARALGPLVDDPLRLAVSDGDEVLLDEAREQLPAVDLAVAEERDEALPLAPAGRRKLEQIEDGGRHVDQADIVRDALSRRD